MGKGGAASTERVRVARKGEKRSIISCIRYREVRISIQELGALVYQVRRIPVTFVRTDITTRAHAIQKNKTYFIKFYQLSFDPTTYITDIANVEILCIRAGAIGVGRRPGTCGGPRCGNGVGCSHRTA